MIKTRFPLWAFRVGLMFAVVPGIPSFAQNAPPPKILGGFFEEWSIYYAGYNVANLQQNGVANQLTHLFYAFANVSAPPGCAIADTYADYQDPYLPSVSGAPYPGPLYGNFAAIQQLEQLHPNMKVLISIGGASFTNATNFSTAASTALGRHQLASSCIDMFIKGNIAPGITAPGLFDGIHIDWEFPTSTDTSNFTALLYEFRKQLNELSATTGKTYDLSFFGPAGTSNIADINLAQASKPVDFITVQGYDLNGPWETVTSEASSLFDDKQDPNFGQDLDDNSVLNIYLKAGVPAAKFLLGLPLYGDGWTGAPDVNNGLYQTSTASAPVPLANGTGLCPDTSGNTPGCDPLLTAGLATYATLENLKANGYTQYFDSQRVAAYLFDSTPGTFYSFDDPETATLKMHYALKQALGGAYVWAVKDDDTNGTMVKTMAKGLGQ
ncbi:MAG TPA: glycosyl hydrolase family 18 protein [Bryobacteraceae bacterium]|nr:glycosyl hydrolase family 18 protein [Bryobacteraceae bacterium]